ncbi:MAG TPA: DUF2182 domain-containing protein [Gemmatimonadaceae bacterium]|nr:DUF2182 domain-containing protein [Gemmatimonadaceae bacterium]
MDSRAWTGDRAGVVTLVLLLLVTVAAWAGVVVQATAMPMGDDRASSAALLLGPTGLVAFVAAWVVMMTAMMLPSAAPMILLYRAVARGRATRGDPLVPTWSFVLGYLAVWAAVGGAVFLADRLVGVALEHDARLAAWAPYGVALVLLAAGVYQFTPLKRVCLRACQHPLGFLVRYWRAGSAGAFRMGLAHGWYCTGCCWGLMAVLVAAGAMGLAWVLLIALVVAAEKLLPVGEWAARLTGATLLALGALVALQPRLALAMRGHGM